MFVTPAEAQPGDIGFCHSTGAFGKLIRIGQCVSILGWLGALRFLWRAIRSKLSGEGVEWPWWANHVVVLLDRAVGTEILGGVHAIAGDWIVGQAEAVGTTRAFLDTVAPGGAYILVSADSFPTVDGKPIDRSRVVAAAEKMLGQKYGFVTIISIVLNYFTPRWVRLDFRQPNTLICSAYGDQALAHGGAWLDVDAYQVSPAELAAIASPAAPPAGAVQICPRLPA